MQVTDPIQDRGSDRPIKVTQMGSVFPPMNDRPEKWMPAVLVAYWILAFAVIPVWLPMITAGLWGSAQFNSWVDVIYHGVNAVVVAGILKDYALEALLEVQLDPKKFMKTVGTAVLMMVPIALFLVPDGYLGEVYPIQSMTVAAAPGVMVQQLPVIGTLCNTVLAPISVTGLLYAAGFAPMCCRKTWLGYLALPVVLLGPVAFEILWRGLSDYVIPTYLLHLPMHFIACWSYQKADTVWAPVATLAIFNLLISILILLPL